MCAGTQLIAPTPKRCSKRSQQYGPSGPGRWLLFERCDRLLGIGVRLRDERRGRHWDRVDLVGVDTERTPVVIELKGTRGQATPLRAAIDATAYGLAIRKAWPHRLRGDWLDALKAAGFGEPRLPVFLNRLTVLIAAPEAYWQDRIGGPETGTRGSVSTAAWQALHDLTDALVPQGFDVVFASLRARSVRGRQPVGVTAWPQHIPRMGR